jgi:transposase
MADLEKMYQKAAGIDLGTEKVFISIDGETVKSFSTFTSSLDEITGYLVKNQIETVLIEATGVIWLPIYDKIEAAGISVCLANASHAKNVPGQKSDPADCRWLQRIHSYGLLRSSFVPKDSIRTLRTYVRQREDHIEMAAAHIQHMQKAFELMNIKLHNVISSIVGASGIKIIENILQGEYDARKLVMLCNIQIIKNKKELVIESLKGNYKPEYLFLLKQAYSCWKFYQVQIDECETQIAKLLKEMTVNLPKVELTKPKPSRHNCPQIPELHHHLNQINKGKNASCLPGFSDTTVLKLLAELGNDFSKWPTEKHFVSWVGLSPVKNQSGKMFKRQRKHKKSTKAGQIFRDCVMSIAGSKYLALKGFYNRIKSKHGKISANKATARKLAVIFFNYMTKGFEYVEQGLVAYENRYKEIVLRNLNKKAYELGYQLVRN